MEVTASTYKDVIVRVNPGLYCLDLEESNAQSKLRRQLPYNKIPEISIHST